MRYKVEGKSRNELRKLANEIRKIFGFENTLYIPIVDLLDIMCELQPRFSYEILEDSEFKPNVHADIDIVSETISIRQSVYDRACSGAGRDRMTIAHELAHYFTLCICGYKLTRSFGEPIAAYEDPEWHAKCLAGELMMGAHLIKGMSVADVTRLCGVTEDAAKLQLKKI